jgi:hypothetical protein
VTYHQIPYAMDQGISEPVSGKNKWANRTTCACARLQLIGMMASVQTCYRQRGSKPLPCHEQTFTIPDSDPGHRAALNLIFVVMGEGRINRTYDEYMAIAARLPPLKILTFEVNRLLQELHRCDGCNEVRLPQLCRFKAGDQKITYEPYPKAISYDTVRTALEIAGMRKPRWRKR